ncbi:hypothetical protein AB4Z40_00620 [Bosea sp. 2YAB26]|uniref:hypothetical protein n=1 Tax=Bosea sp. 2YAB26 TaxID=3237478 RepID=UPI003F8F0304
MEPKEKRRASFFALAQQFRVIGPILSGVLVVMIGLGLVIGRIVLTGLVAAGSVQALRATEIDFTDEK